MLESDHLLSYMEGFSVFEAGDFVKWMEPLDHEYSYGKILRIERNRAFIEEIGGYYAGKVWCIHLRYIRKWERGRKGESKGYS